MPPGIGRELDRAHDWGGARATHLGLVLVISLRAMAAAPTAGMPVGHTEILKWPQGRTAAVSLTFDGGTINQFRVALPLLNERGLRATFFLVTDDIRGSRHPARFIGRSLEEIVAETATTPLSAENFFERATALHFLPYTGAAAAHTRAGDLFESGKTREAYALVDETFTRIRRGELPHLTGPRTNDTVDISWAELRLHAAAGHEFASHSVSHPQLAICDDANLIWQLEQSRAELAEQLGPPHSFSVACPHGTENPRVLAAAAKVYPAMRNRLPDAFLDQRNRWSATAPTAATNAYVMWQRGPKTATPLREMQGWVETLLTRDHLWLVLVFHGVDGVGWEPKTGAELRAYFDFLHARQDALWVAPFREVVQYLRARMHARVMGHSVRDRIRVRLSCPLDRQWYNPPLTLQTRVPDRWHTVWVRQGDAVQPAVVGRTPQGTWARFEARPHEGEIELAAGPRTPR